MEYYEIEKLTFDSYLFNNIDATYILYLKGFTPDQKVLNNK